MGYDPLTPLDRTRLFSLSGSRSALVAALVHVFLRFTSWGRNVYAVGGNRVAARLAGVNINRYIVGVFVVTGLVAAVAGILITARTGSGSATAVRRPADRIAELISNSESTPLRREWVLVAELRPRR